jgi:hypothetical protein
LGGEHAEAAKMIVMDQFPEVKHFTPVILGERNNTNASNKFFRSRSPFIPLDRSLRKGRRKCDMLPDLQIAVDFWRHAGRFANYRGIFNLPFSVQ